MNWREEIKKYEKEMLEDLKGCIRIASVKDESTITNNAPFGKPCREVLDYMFALGQREGFQCEDVDGYAGVLSYGEQEETMGILGHLDIVPIGEDWTKDPLGCEIKDGVIYGRGVLDDKGPSIAAFYALKMLKDNHIPLSKQVKLIFGCDEESGMSCMNYYKEHAKIPDFGFVPDAQFPLIYAEKGQMRIEITANEKTVIQSMHAGERINIVIGKASATINNWQKEYAPMFQFYLDTQGLSGEIQHHQNQATLTIHGTFAHAAEPYLGNNAALHLFNFIGEVYQDTFAKNMYQILKDWKGTGLKIDADGIDMGPLTMNVGIVHIENDQETIILDVRYPKSTNQEKIQAGLDEMMNEYHQQYQIEIMKNSPVHYTDPNSKLVQTLASIYRNQTNDYDSPLLTIGGGTYARKFANFITFGPEFPKHMRPKNIMIGGPHQKDEGMLLEELFLATAIYAEAIEKLAGISK